MKTIYTYKNLPHAFLMSVVLCLFGVFFSFQAYAQHEELLDKTWYLYKLEIDEEESEYYSLEIQAGDEAKIDIMEDYEGSDGQIALYGCPGSGISLEIRFVEDENKIVLIEAYILASDFCDRDYGVDYDIIDIYYINFYMDNLGSIIEYSFETIDAIEYLIFTDENNDKLYYTAENLSIADFEELGFSLYPNPTQDWLHIHLEELSNNTHLEIYDIHGKLLERTMISELETQLDVSEFASGLYFIILTDELKSTQVKKFIKQ